MRTAPYAYVFDASALTDGTSPRSIELSLRAPGEAFELRRVAGLASVAPSLRLYASAVPASSALVPVSADTLFSPGIRWDGRTAIRFDLGAVTRSFVACAPQHIYTSQILFQGARLGAPEVQRVTYRKRLPYTYVLPVSVNWYRYTALPGTVTPARRFAVKVETHDFELHRIRITRSGVALTTPDIALRLYDAGGFELSNAPILAPRINALVGPAAVFPGVPVRYPAGTLIVVDIESWICNLDGAMPKAYEIALEGVQLLK